MPQIQKGTIAGCCVSANFYDLGGAHGKYRSRNIEEFATRVAAIGMNVVNIAMTNDGQNTERGYLEQLGFKEVFKFRGIHVHAVSNTDLEKNLRVYKELLAKRQREEAERKKKEQEERERAAREKAETERKKKLEQDKKELAALAKEPKPGNDDVTIEWVRETYNKYPNQSVKAIFETIFGFKTIPDYHRKHHDAEILRSINSRLAARRRKSAGEKK